MYLIYFQEAGALGIEALSRGAKYVVFCDNNKKATNIIIKNLNKTHLIDSANVFNCDYKKCIEKNTGKIKFDIVFIDPPYKLDVAIKSIKALLDNNLVSENGIIIIETDEIDRDLNEIEKILNDKINVIDKRKYGRANLIFLELDNKKS